MAGSASVWVVLILSLIVAAAAASNHASRSASQMLASQDAQWSRLVANTENQTHVALIAILSRENLVTRFRHVCTHQATDAAAPARGKQTGVPPHHIPKACLQLQGACRRIFRHSFAGVAGHFTRQQFEALHACAGSKGIRYLTRDNQVKKAEGDDHRRWWTYRPPTIMTLEQLQQLAASKLAAATAAGVASGATKPQPARASNSTNSKGPQVKASSGPNDKSHQSPTASHFTMALIQKWILAEVGLVAQQALAQPQVRAADSTPAQEDIPKVDTGDSAMDYGQEASVSSQPHGSRNQDPGIAVDPNAVSRPDIIVHTTSDAAKRTAAAEDLQQPLSLAAAELANKQPGVKEQRLVNALWNLDRIDQRGLPLNSTFSYGSATQAGTGKGVTLYILDSGIKASHQEFQPWDGNGPSRVTVGPDFVDDDGVAADCDGHGTHVASTAAGRSVGVAKEARIVAVRVLDCEGAGSISNVVAALDWVAENAVKPAVVSLSLGVPAGSWSKPMEDAIQHMADVLGIPVVVAAGNSAEDSCEVAPARAASAITVAASNIPTKFSQTRAGDVENLYSWSNTGACVKLFAPGVDIYGACGGASRCAVLNDASYTWASGTSMAAPHVTGAAAVYLEGHPSAMPAEVLAGLTAASSTGHLADPSMLPGTPNKLLFTGTQQ